MQNKKLELMKQFQLITKAAQQPEQELERQRKLIEQSSPELLQYLGMTSEKSWAKDIETLQSQFYPDLISPENQ